MCNISCCPRSSAVEAQRALACPREQGRFSICPLQVEWRSVYAVREVRAFQQELLNGCFACFVSFDVLM